MPFHARIRNHGASLGPGNTLASRWAYLETNMPGYETLERGLREGFRQMFYIGAYELMLLVGERMDADGTDEIEAFMETLQAEMDRALNQKP